MPGKYATNTTVSSGASRNELETILNRYGATNFGYMAGTTQAVVAFVMDDKTIRFTLPLPDRNDDEFRLTPAKKFVRSDEEQEKAYEQAVRSRWRALLLVVKAKLEAIETGIVSFEQEFYAHIVMPGGQTLYEATHEAVQYAIDNHEPVKFHLEIEA